MLLILLWFRDIEEKNAADVTMTKAETSEVQA